VNQRHWFALVSTVSICAGCASAPVHYYTLTSAEVTPPIPAQSARIAIDVRTTTPVQLNHATLMIRTSGVEMTLLENERWVSPLKDEFSVAVRLQLQRRLAQPMKQESLDRFTRVSVSIDVQRLEAEVGRYALLEVSWSAKLSGATGASSDVVIKNCEFRAREAIRGGYEEMVEGYQRDVQLLGDSIFVALTSAGEGNHVACRASAPVSE
jgi:uncharacterized protein